MIPILLALLASTTSTPTSPVARQPPKLPAHGRVTTPEGVRFQLPTGQRYTAESTESGIRMYVSTPRDDTSVLSVTVVRDDARASCAEAARGSSAALRTANGLAGCVWWRAPAEGQPAVAVAMVRGRGVLVVVFAAARSPEIPRDLATRTAESVEIGPGIGGVLPPPLPRNDPRMIGRFQRHLHTDVVHSRGRQTRCFREDSTVSQRFVLAISVGGSTSFNETEKQGRWTCVAGTLAIAWDDGSSEEEEVVFEDSGVMLGDELWTRTSEPPDPPEDEQAGEEDEEDEDEYEAVLE